MTDSRSALGVTVLYLGGLGAIGVGIYGLATDHRRTDEKIDDLNDRISLEFARLEEVLPNLAKKRQVPK